MEGKMLEIKVAGPGCSNCNRLESMVKQILEDMKIEATLIKVSDFNGIADLGVLMTPGLVINGNLLSQGKVPSESQLKEWISSAAGK